MTRPASLRIAGEVPLDALGPVTVVASPPDMLSQRTVESVCGIGPRQFLETIRTPGFPLRVAKLGATTSTTPCSRSLASSGPRPTPTLAGGPADDQAGRHRLCGERAGRARRQERRKPRGRPRLSRTRRGST